MNGSGLAVFGRAFAEAIITGATSAWAGGGFDNLGNLNRLARRGDRDDRSNFQGFDRCCFQLDSSREHWVVVDLRQLNGPGLCVHELFAPLMAGIEPCA